MDRQGEKDQDEYYVKLGLGCDHILRCKDCRRLITMEDIVVNGGCPYCSCRRLVQIASLNLREWFRIKLFFYFPYKKEFLAEFPSPVQVVKAKIKGWFGGKA